ncbi:MAG TPA: EI24 domain-containing protein [Burkholderiales bacterium]|nr:EI24 domain-containing protein [Burkholderiales bacterium]
MNAVIHALSNAIADFRQPRILALALLPPLAALAVWAGLAWFFAEDWAHSVTAWIANHSWLSWVRDWGLSSVFVWASGIGVIALTLPVALIAAVLVTDIFAMPVIVPFVAERNYPRLERRKGGTMAGSLWNAVVAIVVFLSLWVVSLPLWFTGIGAILLPPLLSAYFNERMFRYDALADHADPGEYRAILSDAGGRLYLLGLLLAALLWVPFVNLAVPVLSALAFTHLALAELERLRRVTITGDEIRVTR